MSVTMIKNQINEDAFCLIAVLKMAKRLCSSVDVFKIFFGKLFVFCVYVLLCCIFIFLFHCYLFMA